MVVSELTSLVRWIVCTAFTVLLPALPTGCAGNTMRQPERAAEAPRAYIAIPCATLKEQGAKAVPVGILLEVADVVEPIGAPIKGWLSAHQVEVHHVAKVFVPLTENAPVQGPFGTCLDPSCSEAQDATLEVIVTSAPRNASAPVELQLSVVPENGEARQISVATTDQEPVLVSLTTSPTQTLVITPYYLYEPKQRSLGLLIQCASQTPD